MPPSKESFASEEIHLCVLRLLQENPQMTQRELAEALGVSLGKTNFCIKALFEKGLIKLNNFKSSRHKLALLLSAYSHRHRREKRHHRALSQAKNSRI